MVWRKRRKRKKQEEAAERSAQAHAHNLPVAAAAQVVHVVALAGITVFRDAGSTNGLQDRTKGYDACARCRRDGSRSEET